jgi:catechol 2,3-dioxygenase-like lactoylglutathione lyase family enzyme
MKAFNLTFHHLGLAVRRPQQAVSFLQGLGYRCPEPVFDGAQNVHLIMCTHEAMPAVEIISPGSGATPIDGYLARQPNGLIYHACYACPDLAESLARFEAAGIAAICVSEPTPAILFGGRKVSFYNILGVGLIELIDTEGKPAAAPMTG